MKNALLAIFEHFQLCFPVDCLRNVIVPRKNANLDLTKVQELTMSKFFVILSYIFTWITLKGVWFDSIGIYLLLWMNLMVHLFILENVSLCSGLKILCRDCNTPIRLGLNSKVLFSMTLKWLIRSTIIIKTIIILASFVYGWVDDPWKEFHDPSIGEICQYIK